MKSPIAFLLEKKPTNTNFPWSPVRNKKSERLCVYEVEKTARRVMATKSNHMSGVFEYRIVPLYREEDFEEIVEKRNSWVNKLLRHC